ncbi:MAG: tRNA uridine-5-carboxymethylaminomethyl(34) synthesis GTPase MnmE [Clostridiales Family XIII bacterium]|jgi:tRNA modification GTPase|nr:tRNA uridine-5-carboxymethylaminomethyl(34) synthesis GTPase MnmE [Clostridiales Family XIII bacterium]
MRETIAAVSTAYGEGGIGIVRISGDRAGEILDRLFRRGGESGKKRSARLSAGRRRVFQDKKMYYGFIEDPLSGETLDEVLVVFMCAPHTYTGEDVAEIHCHGSVISLRRILDKTLECGAAPAAAGEFTKRAFLNGRIDLARADAVIDLIKAKTDRGYDAALGQLEGRLSERIRDLRERLTDILAEMTVYMDYPEEDASSDDDGNVRSFEDRLNDIRKDLNELISSSETGRMIRDGISVAIVGKPNVGKSSLLNALLRENRAIVSELPGTTRDSIDEYASIRGIPVRLTDTAGLRDAETAVEALGIERTKEALRKADLIFLTFDGSGALDGEDLEICSLLGERANEIPALAIVNKSDLPQRIDRDEILRLLPGVSAIVVSATTGEGVENIEEYIEHEVYGGRVKQGESLLVTNARHKALLMRADAGAESALEALRREEAFDFAETDIRDAYDALGEITGQTVTDDILDRVFSRFCIGK